MNMKYCPNCGAELSENQDVCINCGKILNNATHSQQPNQNRATNQKSKMAAGLFGIFLGSLGVHNFYLGYTTKGIIQILLTFFGACLIIGPAVSGIWGLVEGILILSGSINEDAYGVPLRD